jgi:hypothetical protein
MSSIQSPKSDDREIVRIGKGGYNLLGWHLRKMNYYLEITDEHGLLWQAIVPQSYDHPASHFLCSCGPIFLELCPKTNILSYSGIIP